MGPNNFDYGCNTSCISSRDVMEGVCMGKGCCQKRIPKGLKYYNTTMTSKGNHTNVFSFSKCGYAFLGEADNYHFQGFKDLSDDNFIDRIRATVPIVLDWAIGTDTCMQAQNSEDYACRENSQCVDADFHGYRCICKPGFQGNPYLTPGCQDIDECADPSTNTCEKNCTNTPGSFYCTCPDGYNDDGKKDGYSCIPPYSDHQVPWFKFSLGKYLGKLS
ncbi:putative high mobility group B protein 1-like isoform X1, partial [Capsicum annuum]